MTNLITTGCGAMRELPLTVVKMVFAMGVLLARSA